MTTVVLSTVNGSKIGEAAKCCSWNLDCPTLTIRNLAKRHVFGTPSSNSSLMPCYPVTLIVITETYSSSKLSNRPDNSHVGAEERNAL